MKGMNENAFFKIEDFEIRSAIFISKNRFYSKNAFFERTETTESNTKIIVKTQSFVEIFFIIGLR